VVLNKKAYGKLFWAVLKRTGSINDAIDAVNWIRSVDSQWGKRK